LPKGPLSTTATSTYNIGDYPRVVNIKDTSGKTDSDQGLLLTLGKYSSFLDIEKRAVIILSVPSGIKYFYCLLSLTLRSYKVQTILGDITPDIIHQVKSWLPCLLIIDLK
jgi:hypothetical protein